MEPEDYLLLSQESATGPESQKNNPLHSHTPFLTSTLILLSRLL